MRQIIYAYARIYMQVNPSMAPKSAPIGKEVITTESIVGDRWNSFVSWSVIVPKMVMSYASKKSCLIS